MDRKMNYKLELLYVKFSPILISLGLLLNNILAYFDIYISVVGSYVFGASLLTIGHLYSSSYTYKFCKYRRMFIHYIVANGVINAIGYYIGVPLSDIGLLLFYVILAGIFLFLVLYCRQRYGTRSDQ